MQLVYITLLVLAVANFGLAQDEYVPPHPTETTTTATTTQRPCNCPSPSPDEKPICGADSKVYPSVCLASCLGRGCCSNNLPQNATSCFCQEPFTC